LPQLRDRSVAVWRHGETIDDLDKRRLRTTGDRQMGPSDGDDLGGATLYELVGGVAGEGVLCVGVVPLFDEVDEVLGP